MVSAIKPERDPDNRTIAKQQRKPIIDTYLFVQLLNTHHGHNNSAHAASVFGSPSVPTALPAAFVPRKRVVSVSSGSGSKVMKRDGFFQIKKLESKENIIKCHSVYIPWSRNTFPINCTGPVEIINWKLVRRKRPAILAKKSLLFLIH